MEKINKTPPSRPESVIKEVDHSFYDFKYSEEKDKFFRVNSGITPDIIKEISREKQEPSWVLEFRLRSLDTYNAMRFPTNWMPDISGLDMNKIASYVRPKTKQSTTWEEVPVDIKETFDRLGIPDAEKKSLSGVGAQYDSEIVYHNVQEEVKKEGIIYLDFDTALRSPEWGPLIKEKFMTLIKTTDHKAAALHGALFSGGSFVYVPSGKALSYPLQSYFRLNAKGAGQFEHTMIILEEGSKLHFIEGCSAPKYNEAGLHAGAVELFVGKRASLRYSTIENWSKNMYNLNTKRAQVKEGGSIEWVSGSFGSHVGCLYPESRLIGANSRAEFTGITFAGKGQTLDTGCKMTHLAPNTHSVVNAKSISKGGGVSIYRSSVYISPLATNSRASVSCNSLMLDSESRSDTIPANTVLNNSSAVGHEARIGKISDSLLFYLMTRGINEAEARSMIVRGFVANVSKELPGEYAVEMNNLINIELTRS